MRSLTCSLVLVASSIGGSFAQDRGTAWIEVTSNLQSSLVMVDSVYAGRSDGSALAIDPGIHRVVLVPSEVGAWDLGQPEEEVEVAAGDTVSLHIDFPYQYRIDSVPFGASVTLTESQDLLGTTPLVYSSGTPLTSPILLRKEGYANAQLDPGGDVINRHSVILESLDIDLEGTESVEWEPSSSKNTWINWAAAAVIVGGGALAVHYKFQADEVYDEYLETGDPATKERVDQLDRYSYIALGAMQVGVGVLAIRLAF